MHNENLTEKRGGLITVRSLAVRSFSLGVSGQCDVVEFRPSEEGIILSGRSGRWLPFPVEYKRGSVKKNPCDEAQLCCQAMCLEEMLCCRIERGALFYGQTRRRFEVEFGDSLRNEVKNALYEMHELYSRGFTPKVRRSKSCESCSLIDVCLPEMPENRSVRDYVAENAEETG